MKNVGTAVNVVNVVTRSGLSRYNLFSEALAAELSQMHGEILIVKRRQRSSKIVKRRQRSSNVAKVQHGNFCRVGVRAERGIGSPAARESPRDLVGEGVLESHPGRRVEGAARDPWRLDSLHTPSPDSRAP